MTNENTQTKKPSMMSTQIPFAGFYESKWSGEIDAQESMEVENWQERQREDNTPDELLIDDSDYAEILFRHSDYSAAYDVIARDYAIEFSKAASEAIGFELRLEFEEMVSPREYNFTTDRIFCAIPKYVVRKLFRMSAKEDHKTFARMIDARHSSRSGFCSFYSNRLSEWIDKSWREFDHNEIATLLVACLEIAGWDDDESEWDVFNAMADGDGFYSTWSDCVAWSKVESYIAEMRAEKLESLQAEIDADESLRARLNPYYRLPTPRCEFTRDLFNA